MYFIERGANITSNYYIEHIIESFIKYDIPHLFLGDIHKKLELHQDNAFSSHVAKDTISLMKEHNINIIMPHEWLPKSPDAARKDWSIWVVVKE